MRKKQIKLTWKLLLCAFFVAEALTLAAGAGLLKNVDLTASDAFYQSPRASEGYIVLVGIDQKALEEISPYTVGLQDSYFTSIDHATQMYGVEFQANAIQSLMWGNVR